MSDVPTRWLHHGDSLLGFSLVARGDGHSVISVQQFPSWGLERSLALTRTVVQNNPRMFKFAVTGVDQAEGFVTSTV